MVTHIPEELALRTTAALLKTVPVEERARNKLPALVVTWVDVMEREFKRYQYREDLGMMMRQA